MAKKKKKQTKTIKAKKAEKATIEQSNFWPLASAVFLFVLALFLLLGGFGTGGPLPKDLFHGAYWTLGWAAYLVPLALVYWGVYKFQSEDHHIPKPEFANIFAVL